MDATYEWACQQVGIQAHPRFHADFAAFAKRRVEPPQVHANGGNAVEDIPLVLRSQSSSEQSRPVQDSDVVSVCLALRSMAKAIMRPPLVHLNLKGEAAITCEAAKAIAAVLQVPCGLHTLILRQTNVSDKGAAALGAALGASTLSVLDLGACRISDNGLKLFTCGVQVHGPPRLLSILLLDGNPLSDAGVVDLIMLLEGPQPPPALTTLSIQPKPTSTTQLSVEVDAALRVVCNLCRIELRDSSSQPASVSLPQLGAAGIERHQLPQRSQADDSVGFANGTLPGNEASAVLAPPLTPGLSTIHNGQTPASPLPQTRSNNHLAAWMASTDRELRDLKWMLGANITRIDAQHNQLMGELAALRGQVDLWARVGAGSGDSNDTSDHHLAALEARFDALENAVGKEQSECSRLWQVIEAAAGTSLPGNQAVHTS